MDIAEVVKLSGLAASTLRYYEEKGLIQASGRKGLRRQYDPEVVEHLALISLGRSAGFSLEQMATLFTSEGPMINRTLLLEKAEELRQKIQELRTIREGLLHAAACKAVSHFECPTFLGLLAQAGKQERKQPRKTFK